MDDGAAWFSPEKGSIRFGGRWTVRHIDGVERLLRGMRWPGSGDLVWRSEGLEALDSGGAWLLERVRSALEGEGRRMRLEGLSADQAELLDIVRRNRPAPPAPPPPRAGSFESIGRWAWGRIPGIVASLEFLGENAATAASLAAHPRAIRWRSFWRNVHGDGLNALPITGLLMFLMGVVIAYQGAEQLRAVGANIYVVDLVGISILREIAPLVTAIIVAGRSGSAYAAQIGTMKVTEELDAVRTLGLSPFALLVFPRMLALIAVLPLLTVYSDILGVFGGVIIAKRSLGVGFTQFLSRFARAVALKHYLIGIGKAPVFAACIALVGCYQGFQVGGGVESVGRNTTASVVKSIFLVIVFDALFSVLFSWWGI